MPERISLPSDEQLGLWKSASQGDRTAVAGFLRSYQDVIYRFCRTQLGNEPLAIEAAQETAVRLIQNLASFRGNSQLTTWVLGFANNVCREQRRRLGRNREVEPADLDTFTNRNDDHASQLERQEATEKLRSVLNELSDRQREAVVLRHFESLSLAETAEVMQVSVGTVKATLSQAMANLKRKLGNLE